MAALPLAACGFTPAFGPAGPARALAGRIATDDPADKNAFDFVGRIEERLGRPDAALWQLSYSISATQVGLGITSSNDITRDNLLGSVSYSVKRLDSGAVATSGRIERFTSYSASGTVIATSTSERDAHERLMRILADQLVTDLIASSADWATP